MEQIFDFVFQTIPVYGYVTDEKEYATQSESEISYETIIAREASDENYVDEHALTTAISRIRGKIEADRHTYIKTVYGMGYMWIGGTQK